MARYLQVEDMLHGAGHPNLVTVRDLVSADGGTTIVTEFVDGSDLRQLIGMNGPLLPAEVARIGAAVAAGLAQLHRSGVVHGDVKPENVLLDETASPKVPRVTDAILARLIGMPRGGHGTPSLTDARYLAPELADSGSATPASDLYALGIMLYEMCCGVAPFVGKSAYSVVRQHVEYEPGRPDGIPEPLWQVIWLLLLKDPQDRQQNANEIAVVLEHMIPELMSAACVLPLTSPPQGRRLGDQSTQREPNARPPIFDDRPAGAAYVPGGPVPKENKRRRVLTATAVAVVLLTGLIVWVTTRSGGDTAEPVAASGRAVVPTDTVGSSVPQVSQTPSSAVPVPAVAPNLVGKSIDQAQDSLPASIQVVTTNTVDTTHPSGTVITQDPAAGQPLTGTMRLTIAEAPETIYLDSLDPADGTWSDTDTNASLGGQTLVHSLLSEFSTCDGSGTTQTVEYNISKGYRKFQATAGIDDGSADSNAEVNLQIFGDNRQLSSTDITFGKPARIDLDVSGVLRLKIQYQPISPPTCINNDFDLGTALLQGLPGEVPASVDPNSSTEPTN